MNEDRLWAFWSYIGLDGFGAWRRRCYLVGNTNTFAFFKLYRLTWTWPAMNGSCGPFRESIRRLLHI